MTSSTKRLYTVTGPNSEQHLVKATSQAQATQAITRDIYKAKVASALDVASLVEAGAKIIDASPAKVPAGVPENV